jgi:hypothetical protein
MANWFEPGSFDGTAKAAGYTKHEDTAREHAVMANAAGVHDTGDYRVLGAYRSGKVTVVIEQNEGPNPFAPPVYADIPIVHDPVAVVTGPVGSVAVNLADADAEEGLKRAKLAVTDPDHQKDAR